MITQLTSSFKNVKIDFCYLRSFRLMHKKCYWYLIIENNPPTLNIILMDTRCDVSRWVHFAVKRHPRCSWRGLPNFFDKPWNLIPLWWQSSWLLCGQGGKSRIYKLGVTDWITYQSHIPLLIYCSIWFNLYIPHWVSNQAIINFSFNLKTF